MCTSPASLLLLYSFATLQHLTCGACLLSLIFPNPVILQHSALVALLYTLPCAFLMYCIRAARFFSTNFASSQPPLSQRESRLPSTVNNRTLLTLRLVVASSSPSLISIRGVLATDASAPKPAAAPHPVVCSSPGLVLVPLPDSIDRRCLHSDCSISCPLWWVLFTVLGQTVVAFCLIPSLTQSQVSCRSAS